MYIEEMVGVYPADYDAKKALAQAKRTLQSCRDVPFTVTGMQGRSYHFTILPPVTSDSPDILLWSFRADDWACDNTFVAAHNAAIEISTCGPVNGYRRAALADDALNRIEKLANTTAWPRRVRSQPLEALLDLLVGQPVVRQRVGVLRRARTLLTLCVARSHGSARLVGELDAEVR